MECDKLLREALEDLDNSFLSVAPLRSIEDQQGGAEVISKLSKEFSKSKRFKSKVTVDGFLKLTLGDSKVGLDVFLAEKNIINADSLGLKATSGMGEKLYTRLWGTLDGSQYRYQPSLTLSDTNNFRMTVMMLKYFEKHGEAPHILMQGTGRAGTNKVTQIGVDAGLAGKNLTKKRVAKLARNTTEWLNGKILKPLGHKITADSSDEALLKMVKDDRASKLNKMVGLDEKTASEYPFGLGTLKLFRRLAQTSGAAASVVFALLLKQEDFTAYLDKQAGEEL